MKTPMQELIEKWELMRDSSSHNSHRLIYQAFIEDAKAMLEKEKEVMCEFAEAYYLNLGYTSAEEYFDRAFNTKEK